jgi:hypothetical protein
MNVDREPGSSAPLGSGRPFSKSGSKRAYLRVASQEFRTSWMALYKLAKLFFSSARKLSTKVRCANSPQRARRAERAVETSDLCNRMRECVRFLSWYVDSLTKCASSSKVVVATSSVTVRICGLVYWEMSWRRGSWGSLAGGGGSGSGGFLEGGDGSTTSIVRGAGDGET